MVHQISDQPISVSPLIGAKDVANLLDKLTVSATSPWDLLQKLGEYLISDEKTNSNERPIIVHYVERALAYSFEDDCKHKGAVVVGVQFSSANGDWPVALGSVPDNEKQAWADVASLCKESLPRVHLFDVAFSAMGKYSRVKAKKIASLYFEIACEERADSYYRASCLRRAWSLARSFGLNETEVQVRQEAFKMVYSQLASCPIILSTLFQLFEFLTVAPQGNQDTVPSQTEIADALKVLRSQIDGSDDLAERVAELLTRVARSESERTEARRALIEGHIAAAANAESGILASYWYERAAGEAKRYHYDDLHDRSVRALQAHPLREKDMHTISFDYILPCYVIDQRLARYRQSRDIHSAIDIWLTTPSPTGSYEKNLIDAKKTAEESLLSIVTRITYDQHGMPVKTVTDPEEAKREQLERIERMAAGIQGEILANELTSIRVEYGVASTRALADHIVATYRCDAKLSKILVEAIDSFWQDRYVDSGNRAYPLIEAGIRGLLLTLEDPLYRVQTGSSSGRFPSLETYVKKLEDHGFDPDWIRCLRNPIAGLRNAIAHGHRFDIRKDEVAILLRVASLLVILTPDDATRQDRAKVEEELRDPITWAAKKAHLTAHWKEEWVLSWNYDLTQTDLTNTSINDI